MKKQFSNKARYLGLKLTAIIFALLLFVSGQSWGQIGMTTTGSQTQNFNTLATSGSSNTWTDNSTITNWYSQRTGNGTTYTADAGSGTAGTLYSYGTGTNTERALGTIGSGNAAAGSFAHGVLLRNTSGTVITDIKVTYTLEQWRKSGVTTAQDITFWYKISSTTISALNPNSNGTWTQVTGLTLSSPINTSTAAALDGNAVANRVTASNVALPSLSLANNDYIMLKWEDPDHSGSDHGLSIDDVTISWTVTSGNTAPTVTTPTATTISTTSATLGGNITADGGDAITERGTIWKTSAGVTISDNKLAEGSTSTGTFSHSRTSLPAGTQIFYKAYATNGIGTTLSSEASFYTLSNEPSNHAASFTATANSQTQIDLAFSAASTITNAAGYLILQRSGAAPTGLPVDATAYTVGNTIGDGTVAAIITNTVDISKSITGLSAGTQYYFTLFPYNGSASTINYKTDGTVPTANATTVAPLDATSEISGPALGSQPNPTIISSLVTTDGAAVRVFDMDIYDFGTDGQPTKVTQLTIKAGSNNTANWANTIQGVKLSTDGGSNFVTIGTPSIGATSIVIPITSGNLNIPDAYASTVSMYIYLKSSGLTDNDILEFKVDATASSHGFTADATGSTLLATFASAPVSNEILVDVEATKLAFVQQPPSNTSPNVAMTPAVTVEATDANNNRDLDYVTDINITSSGTLTGSPVAVTPASGIATFSTLTHTALGNNLTLTAASGTLSNAISNNFSISSLLLVEDFNYANGALLTANGWTAHSGSGTQAIDVTSGLSFNSYIGSGIGGAARVDNNGEDLNKTFTPKTSGSIYAAFIISASSTNSAGYFFHLAQDNISGTTYVSRVWINGTGNSVGIGTSATVAISANTPTLLVVKYNIDTKLSSLYVLNTMSATEPLVADATYTETLTLSNIGAVCLRQYNAAQNIIVDGIRVTTSWSDIAIAFSGTGEWTNSSLWNTGAVPAATESVLINGDATITGNVEVAGLTINSGKSLSVNAGKQLTVTGT